MIKVGILIIATSKYYDFVEPLLESVRKYFFALPDFEVVPFVFTDHKLVPSDAIRLQIKHRPWPMTTLMRFHSFLKYQNQIEKMDFLYYCDADMKFVDAVGEEILGDTVGTVHPLFYDQPREKLVGYEGRSVSTAYIPPNIGKRYYQAAFFGGKTEQFIAIANELSKKIDADLDQDIIAKWHDESHLNRFFAYHPPSIELSPSYCYPENISIPFKPKIVGLDKNNRELRSDRSFLGKAISLSEWLKFGIKSRLRRKK